MYSFALAALAAVATASYQGDVQRSYQPYQAQSYDQGYGDRSYAAPVYGRRHQNLDLDDDKKSYASYGRRSDARREDSDLNTDKDGETYGHENGDHQNTEFGEKDNRNDDDLDARGYSGLTGGSRGSVRGVQANRDTYNNGYGERSYGFGSAGLFSGSKNTFNGAGFGGFSKGKGVSKISKDDDLSYGSSDYGVDSYDQGYGYGDSSYGLDSRRSGYGDRSLSHDERRYGYGDRTYSSDRSYGYAGRSSGLDYGLGDRSYGAYGDRSYGRADRSYGVAPRDSYRGDYSRDSYRGDDYSRVGYRGDDYSKNSYRGDDYSRDSYRGDDYSRVALKGDDYSRDSYRGDDYKTDSYSQGYGDRSYGADSYDQGYGYGDRSYGADSYDQGYGDSYDQGYGDDYSQGYGDRSYGSVDSYDQGYGKRSYAAPSKSYGW